MSEESKEQEFFLKIAGIIEDDVEIDAVEFISALMRVAAVVVAQAPDGNYRDLVTTHMMGGFALYLMEVLEKDSKSLTEQEKRNVEKAKMMLGETQGGMQ